MSTLRRFSALDLFHLNKVNLDRWTENYDISFYLEYLATWPDYFVIMESPTQEPMAYIMGKAEGINENWHGHVTALTVGPAYRRLGFGEQLMNSLEEVTIKVYNGFFIDLFVRVSNIVACTMYQKLGYVVYRRIIKYYTGAYPEDAYDLRKATPRDVHKKSMIPLPKPVQAYEVN